MASRIIINPDPKNVVIPRRFVLIEAPVMDDVIKMGQIDFKIDSSFNPGKWVNKQGVVVAAPKKMKFDRHNPNESQDYDCEIETKPGDIVFFDYFGALMMWGRQADARQEAPNPLFFKYEDKYYGFLDYTEIFCIQREGKIIPINGYVLYKKIMAPKVSSLDIIDRYIENQGIAVLVGQSNKEYLGEKYVDGEVNPGDHIVFLPIASREVQIPGYPDHMVVQKRYIMGVINDTNS